MTSDSEAYHIACKLQRKDNEVGNAGSLHIADDMEGNSPLVGIVNPACSCTLLATDGTLILSCFAALHLSTLDQAPLGQALVNLIIRAVSTVQLLLLPRELGTHL